MKNLLFSFSGYCDFACSEDSNCNIDQICECGLCVFTCENSNDCFANQGCFDGELPYQGAGRVVLHKWNRYYIIMLYYILLSLCYKFIHSILIIITLYQLYKDSHNILLASEGNLSSWIIGLANHTLVMLLVISCTNSAVQQLFKSTHFQWQCVIKIKYHIILSVCDFWSTLPILLVETTLNVNP